VVVAGGTRVRGQGHAAGEAAAEPHLAVGPIRVTDVLADRARVDGGGGLPWRPGNRQEGHRLAGAVPAAAVGEQHEPLAWGFAVGEFAAGAVLPGACVGAGELFWFGEPDAAGQGGRGGE